MRFRPWTALLVYFVAIVFAALGGVCSTNAQTWSSLSGKVENSVRTPVGGDGGATSEYIQNYVFGLRGQLFSSKFLSYYLGTRLEDRAQKSSRSQQFYWYDASATLFRGRPISLRMHARKSEINLIGSKIPTRYEDDNGAELFYYTQDAPRIQAGFRRISQSGLTSGDIYTDLTTLRVENSFRDARVSASFRDENRVASGNNNSTRIQETRLRGTAMPFSGTQITSDLQFRKQDDYGTIRAILQAIGTYRTRDRLNAHLAINRFVKDDQETTTREIRGDYRRYLTPHFHVATQINSNHSTSRSPLLTETMVNDDFGAGAVYLNQSHQSRGRGRVNGQIFAHYYETQIYGKGAVTSHTLSGERQQYLARWFSLLGRVDQQSRLERFADQSRNQLTHALLLEEILHPLNTLSLISRTRFTDTQGFDRVRRFEQREEIVFSPHVRFVGVSALTLDRILVPWEEESLHWSNRVSWLLTRHLTLNGQSVWVVNRTTGVEHFWVETTSIYRYRKLEFQMTIRQEIQYDSDNLAVFFRGARIFGDGIAVR